MDFTQPALTRNDVSFSWNRSWCSISFSSTLRNQIRQSSKKVANYKQYQESASCIQTWIRCKQNQTNLQNLFLLIVRPSDWQHSRQTCHKLTFRFERSVLTSSLHKTFINFRFKVHFFLKKQKVLGRDWLFLNFHKFSASFFFLIFSQLYWKIKWHNFLVKNCLCYGSWILSDQSCKRGRVFWVRVWFGFGLGSDLKLTKFRA